MDLQPALDRLARAPADHAVDGVGEAARADDAQPVYLRDIWPSNQEVQALVASAMQGEAFRANYAKVKTEPGALWEAITGVTGDTYDWPTSTYIAHPPFFEDFSLTPDTTSSVSGPVYFQRTMPSASTTKVSGAPATPQSSA